MLAATTSWHTYHFLSLDCLVHDSDMIVSECGGALRSFSFLVLAKKIINPTY